MFVEFPPLLTENMGSSPTEFIRKLLQDYNFSIYVMLDDYDALKGEMIKINSAKELTSFCKNEMDHVNLFLSR